MRRNVYDDVGPIEAEYGQFAPALLSARMDRRGLAISTVPSSSVFHDDSPRMSDHHDDTADYVRGEMNARARSDPEFFETYFGFSPLYGRDMILSHRHARSMIKALLVATLRRPGVGFQLARRASELFPAALLGLRLRARFLAMLTRADEGVVMHMPFLDSLRWRRFLLAHRRVVHTEQMLWLARHASSPLPARAGSGRWPIDEIGPHAIVGLHGFEHFGGKALRWTLPVFLLRLALPASQGCVTLETRKLRAIASSDMLVVVDGRIVATDDIAVDDTGNIRFRIGLTGAQAAEIDVVVIVRELREGGRRVGLPLFSVHFTGA